jgi:hypothetical protein
MKTRQTKNYEKLQATHHSFISRDQGQKVAKQNEKIGVPKKQENACIRRRPRKSKNWKRG